MLTGVFGAFVKGAYGFLRIWVFWGSSAKVVTGSAIHAVLSKGAKALGLGGTHYIYSRHLKRVPFS